MTIADEPEAPEHTRPTIWQLAVPSIASNLMFSMVAMVQTKFVGSMGAPAVAAVGAGQRVFFALQASVDGHRCRNDGPGRTLLGRRPT